LGFKSTGNFVLQTDPCSFLYLRISPWEVSFPFSSVSYPDASFLFYFPTGGSPIQSLFLLSLSLFSLRQHRQWLAGAGSGSHGERSRRSSGRWRRGSAGARAARLSRRASREACGQAARGRTRDAGGQRAQARGRQRPRRRARAGIAGGGAAQEVAQAGARAAAAPGRGSWWQRRARGGDHRSWAREGGSAGPERHADEVRRPALGQRARRRAEAGAGGAQERVEAEQGGAGVRQVCAVGASWRAGLGRCVRGGPRSRASQTALARPERHKRECGACAEAGGAGGAAEWPRFGRASDGATVAGCGSRAERANGSGVS
jgi:hypothetical protein